MTILDLTEDYITLRVDGRGYEQYEKLYPALFEHYFSHWCPREREDLAIIDKAIRERAQRVMENVKVTEQAFAKRGLDVSDLTVALFVGKNTSNGHAFLDGDRWVIWLPVETYTSNALARVFIAHEIAHALHYRMSPDFYFRDHESKNHLGRQLITEGLATYVTAEVLGISDVEALWADYLSEEKSEAWMSECRGRETELRDYCREHFDESIPDCGLFMANDPGDVMHFRAGYLVGLELVRQAAYREKFDLPNLLTLGRNKFMQLARYHLPRLQF